MCMYALNWQTAYSMIQSDMHLCRGAYLHVSFCISILHTGTHGIYLIVFLDSIHANITSICAFYCAESAVSRRMENSQEVYWTGRQARRASMRLRWSLLVLDESVRYHTWGGTWQPGQQPQLQHHNRLLAKNHCNQTTRSTICEEKISDLKTVPRRKLRAEIH